jgi:hypothetical protein
MDFLPAAIPEDIFAKIFCLYCVYENMKYVENHAFHYRKTKIKGFESDDMNMH